MVGVAFICCTFVAKIKCHCKPLSLKINDATLEHNTSSQLLGIMTDQTLKWDTYVKHICTKINPKIGLIHRLRKILPTKVLSHTNPTTY